MSHNKLIKEALELNNLEVPEDFFGKIEAFMGLLFRWNQKINLTGHRQEEEVIYKDIVDSLHLTTQIQPLSASVTSILDMGSGAGFSGVILSLLYPAMKVGFLDSNRKKMNFVRQACRELGIKRATFHPIRSEAQPRELEGLFAATVSRATWRLEEYLGHAIYYVQNNGYIFSMAGKARKHGPLVQVPQGLESREPYFYKIEPKGYERVLLSYKKID